MPKTAAERKIVVLDGREVPNPEDMAMLQAMYSRSPRSVVAHLEKVRETGSAAFHERFYVGYGHKSIGDGGTIAMFIEQVSMLCAKAVQDTPLYCGQEASTRYLDMAVQGVANPAGSDEGEQIQRDWMALYTESLAALIASLSERHPRQEDENPGEWKKAIKARAFDIARSLLPAGAETLVAWSTNLRQTNDHLKELRNHPLPEIRAVADELSATLLARYPASFGHEVNPAEELYIRESMNRFAYCPDIGSLDPHNPYDFRYKNRLDGAGLSAHQDLLVTRPPRTELHQRFRRFGQIDFEYWLDFGSYRDIQRQRSSIQEMPLLTTRYGFHPWYLEHLPAGTAEKIAALTARVDRLEASAAFKQYYVPMGYLVPVIKSCSLPSAVYIAELRSGRAVHPTLRPQAQRMGEAVRTCVPGISLYHNTDPDAWSIKRGKQDIVAKA